MNSRALEHEHGSLAKALAVRTDAVLVSHPDVEGENDVEPISYSSARGPVLAGMLRSGNPQDSTLAWA
jgi:hypothetical protein